MGKLIPKSDIETNFTVDHVCMTDNCKLLFMKMFILISFGKQVINHPYLNESMLLNLCFVMIIPYNQSAKKRNSHILLWSIIELKLLN